MEMSYRNATIDDLDFLVEPGLDIINLLKIAQDSSRL